MTNEQLDQYRVALKAARGAFDTSTKRLEAIHLEETILNYEVAKLRRTITALAAMCGDPGLDDLGITKACAEVMEAEKGSVTTAGVIDALDKLGFDLKTQRNANASVHAILSRMARKGKVLKVPEEEDQPVKWRGPNYDANWDEIPF